MTTPLDRAAFPVTARHVYLNHAGVNALPTPVVDAMTASARAAAEAGSLASDADEARAEEVRVSAARLMGVGSEEVAFVKNTTEGLAFVASGLDWAPGDRVVVPGCEFPSAYFPWKALEDRGVVVDEVPPEGPGRALPLSAFVAALEAGPPPKMVALSWVQFGRGWRSDLPAVVAAAHEAGALVCADVIQGLGVLPAHLGAWGVDFAAADAHKWLLGPSGIGLLYVRRSCLERLRVLEPGWASVRHRGEWDNLALDLDGTARRFEGGTPNVVGIHGLGAALEMLLDASVEAVWAHVDGLCDRLCRALGQVGAEVGTDRRPEVRSGIVSFTVPGTAPEVVVARLLEAGVVCAARDGGVRVSPHGFCTEDDVDAVTAVVAERCRP